MKPFIVLAQPRSRTAWLSAFLTYGPWHCGHEEARHMRSLEDCDAFFRMPYTGTAETAVAPHWRTLLKLVPNINIVVVRRPIEESVLSFLKLGLGFDAEVVREAIVRIDRKLAQIVKRVPGVMEVQFKDLTDEGTCARIFEFCLDMPHDHKRWMKMSQMNIQCSMLYHSRYATAYLPALQKMGWIAKNDALLDLDRRRVFFEGPELTFKEETDFDAFLVKTRKLRDQHAAGTGWEPGADDYIDRDLIQSEMARGGFHVISAASNGVVHGYIMAQVGPSLAQKGELIAEQASFYAAPTHPGIGRKLQKALREALRHHGVHKLKLRAGINGDGPRLRRVFERQGAVYQGETFTQTL